jgi:hypothetical protein
MRCLSTLFIAGRAKRWLRRLNIVSQGAISIVLKGAVDKRLHQEHELCQFAKGNKQMSRIRPFISAVRI